MYYRYIDDIRILLKPITKGWRWLVNKWVYDPEYPDTRTGSQRTIEEVNKCLNVIWDFLEFTVESQSDYQDGFLPTLDFCL